MKAITAPSLELRQRLIQDLRTGKLYKLFIINDFLRMGVQLQKLLLYYYLLATTIILLLS